MKKISLAAARVNARKTQAELSKALGVSKNMIIDWELDRKPIPMEKLTKYCALCECNPKDIDCRVLAVTRL